MPKAKIKIELVKDGKPDVRFDQLKKKLRTTFDISCEPIPCPPTRVEYNLLEAEVTFSMMSQPGGA